MQNLVKLFTIIISVLMAIGLIIGCANIKNLSFIKPKLTTKTYFQRGVYQSTSLNKKFSYKNYFYVFYDAQSGHTEESEKGIGLPFSCVQTEKNVKFKFGGIEEPEKIFKIKSAENDVIIGSFEDELMLIFTPVKNVNPDNFDAVEFIKNKNYESYDHN